MLNTEIITDNQAHETTRVLRTPIDRFIAVVACRISRSKAKEIERFIKFAVVGTIGAIVDFGTLNHLQATTLPPVDELHNPNDLNVALATSIAFVAAIASNFIWNRYWTYPDSRSRSIRRQVSQFIMVSIIGWLGRTLWITLSFTTMGGIAIELIQFFSPGFTATPFQEARIGTNLAQLIGIMVVLIWNFFVNRYWTYNDID